MAATPATSTSSATGPILCMSTIFPDGGVIDLGLKLGTVTVGDPLVYKAPCSSDLLAVSPTSTSRTSISGSSGVLTVTVTRSHNPECGPDANFNLHDSPDATSNYRDPFYASAFPIAYALGAATVTAYMLVIMLFITPRSFLDGGVVHLGRRTGFTHSSSGGVIIGGRPWLQKVAALTVAISLTIATADSFRIAKKQYSWGATNAEKMQEMVMGSTELRVIRLISDTFLWLAQAQTLIRLFPRHREKVIIKWAAFALISLEIIFSALNSFKYTENGVYGSSMPSNFDSPMPALSYLFQLSLGFLYAAWVIYYSFMKKRYAFYHPLMPNICLVAAVSLTSIVIPIVFFILDISEPTFTSWGDYVRWVGAAAASVVVWEWVERIEALEREEKKDGILGREVFEGDDMLQVNASSESPWLRHRKNPRGGEGAATTGGGGAGGDGGGGSTGIDGSTSGGGNGTGAGSGRVGSRHIGFVNGNGWPAVASITGLHRSQNHNWPSSGDQPRQRTMVGILRPTGWPTRPTPALTPVSRTDTASAASTVYAVRYPAASESTSRTPDPPIYQQNTVELSRQNSLPQSQGAAEPTLPPSQAVPATSQTGHVTQAFAQSGEDLEANDAALGRDRWQTLAQTTTPLSQRRTNDPPAEVLRHSVDLPQVLPAIVRDRGGRWDIRSRLEDFAANQADKIRERIRPTTNTDSLPVTVIPAPPRRGAALQQVLEEEERNNPEASDSSSGQRQNSRSGDASLDRHDKQESAAQGSSGRGDSPLGANQPPLWPGVRPRHLVYEDDDASSYDDSLDGTESTTSDEHEWDE